MMAIRVRARDGEIDFSHYARIDNASEGIIDLDKILIKSFSHR